MNKHSMGKLNLKYVVWISCLPYYCLKGPKHAQRNWRTYYSQKRWLFKDGVMSDYQLFGTKCNFMDLKGSQSLNLLMSLHAYEISIWPMNRSCKRRGRVQFGIQEIRWKIVERWLNDIHVKSTLPWALNKITLRCSHY